MKIVFLIHSFAQPHGVERTLIDKANYLSNHGHTVTLLTYEQGSHPYIYPLEPSVKKEDLNCRFFTLYRYGLIRRRIEMIKMCRVFRKKLHSFVESYKPDLLVSTTYSREFMSEIMSVKSIVPIVIESHTSFAHDMVGKSLIDRFLNRCFLNVLKNCNMLIALTKADAEDWKKFVNNVKQVPNPLTNYCEYTNQYSKLEGRIICVGRLSAQKRYDRLIDSFALIADKYPEWYIEIFGEGEDEKKLSEQIKRNGLQDRIKLNKPTSNVTYEYQRSQMLVLSSDYEGFGLVLIEAMGAGIPVVSTDCPHGPAEIITDGITGLLANKNVEDLASKIEWMIVHPDKRRQMGINAHKAVARYRIENVMQEWEDVYESVLNKSI